MESSWRARAIAARASGETRMSRPCASARGLALAALEHRLLAQMRAARMAQTPDSLIA
jgi:hypothetical protein